MVTYSGSGLAELVAMVVWICGSLTAECIAEDIVRSDLTTQTSLCLGEISEGERDANSQNCQCEYCSKRGRILVDTIRLFERALSTTPWFVVVLETILVAEHSTIMA